MTWSLKLQGGDLVKGKGSSLSTTSGSAKVQQDLLHWVMTEYGSNPFSPFYGSLIDFEEGSIIIEENSETLFIQENKLDLVVSEVDRIIDRYQSIQLVRLEQEVILFNGRHTFAEGEIIESYSIEYDQVLDTLYIDIFLEMLDNSSQAIALTIKGQTV